MQISHRVAFNTTKIKLYEYVLINGITHNSIDMPDGKSKFIYLDITEADPHWPYFHQLMKLVGASDIWDTYFTQEEVLNAEWLRMHSTYDEGYPQPEGSWVMNPNNYINDCPQCGTFQQVRSFQIKKEPSLRGRDFLNLFWAPLAFFCTPRVLRELEAHNIRGYEPWNAIIRKSQEAAQKIFQLYVPNETRPGLVDGEELDPKKCEQCGLIRYMYHARGVMQYRREAFDPDLDMLRSYEWFGSEKEAYKEVFVSRRVAKIVYENGWKGVRFKVVNLV